VVEPITGVVRPGRVSDFSPRTIAVVAGPDENNVYLYIGGNFVGTAGSTQGAYGNISTPGFGLLTSLATYDVYGFWRRERYCAEAQEVVDLAVDPSGNVILVGRVKSGLYAYSTFFGSIAFWVLASDWQAYAMKLTATLSNGGWFQTWGISSSARLNVSRTISSEYSTSQTIGCASFSRLSMTTSPLMAPLPHGCPHGASGRYSIQDHLLHRESGDRDGCIAYVDSSAS